MHHEGKVEDGGSLGQFEEVALGCEDKDLVAVEVYLEAVDEVLITFSLCLKGKTYVFKPLFEFCAAILHPLIAPVGGETTFGYLVHALRAYLYFYPFALWSHDRDVE